MVPNCAGCKYELEEAYEWQQKGYPVMLENRKLFSASQKSWIFVILEHMGERGHLFITVLNKKGTKIILE